jgi:hypothetical protein
MQEDSFPSAGIALIIGLVALGVVLWILPVALGIRVAQRKGYSPHWMWFGVHPIGGWVAFIVMASLEQKTQCRNCGGYIGSNFKICPYCHENVPRFVEKKLEPQFLE